MDVIKRTFRPEPRDIINEGLIGGVAASLLNIIIAVATGFYPPLIEIGATGFFAGVATFFLNLLPSAIIGIVIGLIYVTITRTVKTNIAKRMAWVVALIIIILMTFPSLSLYQYDSFLRYIMIFITVSLPTFTITSNT